MTTGTGSGKSLCFFVPVVDAIVRARKAGRPRKTRADHRLPNERFGEQPDQGNREVHFPIRASRRSEASGAPLHGSGKPGGASTDC
ncbi:MAG: hypothetical protein V9G14_08670 [Cypionkella sp.]